MEDDENIINVIPVSDFESDQKLFLASSNGKKLLRILEVQDGRKCIEL